MRSEVENDSLINRTSTCFENLRRFISTSCLNLKFLDLFTHNNEKNILTLIGLCLIFMIWYFRASLSNEVWKIHSRVKMIRKECLYFTFGLSRVLGNLLISGEFPGKCHFCRSRVEFWWRPGRSGLAVVCRLLTQVGPPRPRHSWAFSKSSPRRTSSSPASAESSTYPRACWFEEKNEELRRKMNGKERARKKSTWRMNGASQHERMNINVGDRVVARTSDGIAYTGVIVEVQ